MSRTPKRPSRRFSPDEKAALERDGFVVRRDAFDARELREIRDACEALCQRLLDLKRRRKWPVGAHVFELQREFGTMVKWVERFETRRLVPLVVPAGTVAHFGPYRVHRSQPAGRKHMREVQGFVSQNR